MITGEMPASLTKERPFSYKLVPVPRNADIIKQLSKVKEVDAIFTTENGLFHVYSVIREMNRVATRKILKAEDRLMELYPNVPFEFHTRFHRGLPPERAVPIKARKLFER
jgi:hypothetical protein